MPSSGIRALALAVIRRRVDELLVLEGHDEVKGETFYRPLGGGIEFGEPAAEALRREMREELAVELDHVELLGVVENIFRFAGRPGHEINFLFTAEVADPRFYERDDPGPVLDSGTPVVWLPRAEVVAGGAILYPTGLAELL